MEYNGGSKVPITLNNSQVFPDIQFLEAIVIECPNSFFLRKPFRPFCYPHDICGSHFI